MEANSDSTEEFNEKNKKCQTDFYIMKSKSVQTQFEAEKSKFYSAQTMSPNRYNSKTLRYQRSMVHNAIHDNFSQSSSDKDMRDKLSEKEREAPWSSGKPAAKPRVSAITNVVFQENNFLNDHSSSTSILPALKKTSTGAKSSRNDLFSYPRSPEQKSVDKLKRK